MDGVDLTAADGELLVIVGPSGSGKTTLLRCVAGLEPPDEGRIEVGGRDVTHVPPGRRDVAMVFQDFALYPHLTVEENISFGLKAARVDRSEIERRVQDASELLGLGPTRDRRPGELSGGERQRVALSRAIVREPALFLLDEPLSNLDAELRTTTRAEIRALQRRLGTTAIYVTHDQVEAMTMGDRVAVLRAGRLEQVAPPTVLYDRPETSFVARFLGSPPMNLFSSALLGGIEGAPLLGVRPEHVRVVGPPDGRIDGRVAAVELLGDVAVVHVDVAGERLAAKVLRETAPTSGEEVGLAFDDARVHAFRDDGTAIR
ncbi:MAG: ABC transporter ATP-binding protein [Actinomycetota bacterium]|nr:ABC transporter ATP-binding protein [Actinomycetota bacterium]